MAKTDAQALDGVVVDYSELLATRALARDIELNGRSKSQSVADGVVRSAQRGRGMEFAEVRLYQAGDDIRNIDWRVTARTQETYTKLFQEEKERPVYVLIDQRSSMFFGSRAQFKSVLAAKLAAVIAWAAFKNRDKIGALVFSEHSQSDFRPKAGKTSLFHILNAIVDFNQSLFRLRDKTGLERSDKLNNLASMTNELHRIARPGSLIYIISDFHDLDAEAQKTLSLLRRHNDINLISISDPMESKLPKFAQLALTDGNSKTSVNSATSLFQKQFSEQYRSANENLKAAANKLGCNLRFLTTEKAVTDQIVTLFRAYVRKPQKSTAEQ